MFTLSHRTPLPASMIATFLLLTIIADLQLAYKGTTYWPKYTIKCVGVSIRLPYATETINLAKPLGNNLVRSGMLLSWVITWISCLYQDISIAYINI